MDAIKLDIGVVKQAYSTQNGGIFYLDTTDTNVVTRFSEKYSEIQKLAAEYGALDESREGANDESSIKEIGEKMRDLDDRVKAAVDYIFDDGVSCAIWGKSAAVLSLDKVFDKLLGLYSKEISKAVAASKQRINRAIPKQYQKK